MVKEVELVVFQDFLLEDIENKDVRKNNLLKISQSNDKNDLLLKKQRRANKSIF